MLPLLLILLALIGQLEAFTRVVNDLTFLQNTEAGRFDTLLSTYGVSTILSQFNVAFKNTYTGMPKFTIAIIEYYNSPPGGEMLLDKYYFTLTSTSATIGMIFDDNLFTSNSMSKYHYLASSNPNLYIQSSSAISYNTTTNRYEKQMISTFRLNSSLIYKSCFLTWFYSMKIRSPNTFQTVCTIKETDPFKYTVAVTTTAQTASKTTLAYFSALFIKNSHVQEAFYVVDSLETPPLQITIAKGSFIFMGIHSYDLPSGTIFQIGMAQSNLEISSTTRNNPFNQIIFNYLYVTPPQAGLPLIATFPFHSEVHFLFKNLQSFQAVSGNPPTVSSPLSYLSYNQYVLRASIDSQITQSQVTLHLQVQNAFYNYHLDLSLSIFAATKMTVYALKNSFSIILINTDPNYNINSYWFNDSSSKVDSFERLSSDSVKLGVVYDQVKAVELFLFSNILGEDTEVAVMLLPFKLKSMITSAKTKEVTAEIHKVNYLSLGRTRFQWAPPNTELYPFAIQADGSTLAQTEYLADPNTTPLQIKYIPKSSTKFESIIEFKLITVQHVEIYVNSSQVKVAWINLETDSADINDFSVGSGGPSIQSVTKVGNLYEVSTDSSSYNNGDQFNMTYKNPDSSFSAVVTNIYYHRDILQNISIFGNDNQFNLTLKNVDILPNRDTLYMYFTSQKANITTFEVVGNYIVLACKILETVENDRLSVVYETNKQTIFKHIITMNLEGSNSLLYCLKSEALTERAKIIWGISLMLAILYIITFLVAIFSCKKMLAIELIYLVQLAFYSLIPIGIFCDPFRGLEGLKYSSGITSLFSNLPSTYLPSNFSSMGISSNFLSNVNILMLPLLILPLFYYPLTHIGNKSNNIHTKPRCLKYGKSLVFQVPFTILLFNAFNIYTSFVISSQFFNKNSTASFVIALLVALLLPIFVVIFIVYNVHFCEFRNEFEDYFTVFNLNKQTITNIRRMYPLLLVCEFMITPMLLSIQSLFKGSLYAIFGLQVLITVLVLIFRPYPTKKQNIRNGIHRTVVLAIVMLQIATMIFKTEDLQEDSYVYWMPFALLGLLLFGLAWTGGYALYESVKFWKAPKLVDGRLKIKQISQKEKPVEDLLPSPSGESRSHPRSPFTPFKVDQFWVTRPPGIPLVRDVEEPNLYNYVQKYVNWFSQIGQKKLYNRLKINKQEYIKVRSLCPSQQYIESYMLRLFPQVKVFQVLFDFHDTIITLQDMIQFEDKCQNRSFREDHKMYLRQLPPQQPKQQSEI